MEEQKTKLFRVKKGMSDAYYEQLKGYLLPDYEVKEHQLSELKLGVYGFSGFIGLSYSPIVNKLVPTCISLSHVVNALENTYEIIDLPLNGEKDPSEDVYKKIMSLDVSKWVLVPNVRDYGLSVSHTYNYVSDNYTIEILHNVRGIGSNSLDSIPNNRYIGVFVRHNQAKGVDSVENEYIFIDALDIRGVNNEWYEYVRSIHNNRVSAPKSASDMLKEFVNS
jgi:hypothetical protein